MPIADDDPTVLFLQKKRGELEQRRAELRMTPAIPGMRDPARECPDDCKCPDCMRKRRGDLTRQITAINRQLHRLRRLAGEKTD